MRRSAQPVVLLAALFLGACGSTTTSGGEGTGGPAPKPIDPSAPPPPEEGTGPAVTYRPVSGARYRLEHRDSLGNALEIMPGAVNWMIAGRGISHSERTGPEERAKPQKPLFGIQTWVALPEGAEDGEAGFEHAAKEALPVLEANGAKARLILGSASPRARSRQKSKSSGSARLTT